MDRKPVKSSNIVSVGHSPQTNEMEIEFANGGVYHYAGVPAHIHDALVNAESVGSHFHKHIRPNFTGKNVGKKQ